MVTQQPPPSYLYNVMLSLSFVIAQFIVLGLFFTLHKFYIANVVRRQYHCDSSVFEIYDHHRNG